MPGPYNFESQPKFARNLVLSPYIQPAWNTALADAKMTYRQRFDGAAVLERTITRRSDIDYAGKGTAFATNGQITAYDTKFTGLKHEATSWLLGYYISLLMGKETVTGSASPYTHTFTFDESTRTAQKTSVYVEDTEDMHYLAPDMAVDELTITINDIGAVMVEASMIGTGYWTEHTLGSLPDAPDETYLLNSDAALNFGPSGDTASFIGRHMSTTLKLQNQCTLHRAPGGGLYGIFVRKGNPKFSLSSTFAAKDTDDVYSLFQSDTACDYELAINSGATSQMSVSIPAMHLKTAKLGLDGDMVVWQVENDETTNYQAAGTPPITIEVINSLAAYLTAGS